MCEKWDILLTVKCESEESVWPNFVDSHFNDRWLNETCFIADVRLISDHGKKKETNALYRCLVDTLYKGLENATEDVQSLLEFIPTKLSRLRVFALNLLLHCEKRSEWSPDAELELKLKDRITRICEALPGTPVSKVRQLSAWAKSPFSEEDCLLADLRNECRMVEDKITEMLKKLNSEHVFLLSLDGIGTDQATIDDVTRLLHSFAATSAKDSTLGALESAWSSAQQLKSNMGDYATQIWQAVVVEKKSELFKMYVRANVSGASLSETITSADELFRRLYSYDMKWKEVGHCMTVLRENKLVAKKELSLLHSYYMNDRVPLSNVLFLFDEDGFTATFGSELPKLVCGTNETPSILSRFRFACHNDAAFRNIEMLTTNVDGEVNGEIAVPQRLLDFLDDALIGCDVWVSLHVLFLLSSLPKYERLWNFFEEREEYVDGLGNGYTDVFDADVDMLGHVLRGERQKLFEAFVDSGFYVALIMGCRRLKTWSELMLQVMKNEQLVRSFQTVSDVRNCIDSLVNMDNRMAEIESIFTYGAGDLDKAQQKCDCFPNGMVVEVALPSGAISVLYVSTPKCCEIQKIEAREVSTFISYVKFLSQQDQSEEAQRLQTYANQLIRVRSKAALLEELHASGDPEFEKEKVYIECVEGLDLSGKDDYDGIFMDYVELDGLEETLRVCYTRLEKAMKTHPALSLYSVPEALHMHSRLKTNSSAFESVVYSNLYAPELTTAPALGKGVQWTDTLSDFLRSLAPTSACPTGYPPASANAEGGYQFKCTSYAMVLAAMTHIYSARAPCPFELLWCSNNTREGTVKQFVIRARNHPDYHFTLVHVDRLPYAAILLLSSLLREHFANGAMNIDVIECEEAATIPALLRKWPKALDASSKTFEDTLKRWRLKEGALQSAPHVWKCYVGPPGSGKTFLVKQDAKKAGASRRFPIVIHEGFDRRRVLDLIRHAVEEAPSEEFFIGIEISVGLYTRNNRANGARWLEEVNMFLFDLLVCRRIYDTASGAFILLQPNHLRYVSVEVPDSIFWADSAAEAASALGSLFPLVPALCQRVSASDVPTVIGKEFAPLGRYLKAYEEGEIDVLCKRQDASILILLDVSGSMKENNKLGRAKIAIKDFIGYLIKEGMKDSDRLGLAVFNHGYSMVVNFFSITTESIPKLHTALDAIENTDGGTCMWDAIRRGSLALSGEHDKKQWIVVFSDGESHDCPNVLKEVSREVRSKQSVVFLGVDLMKSYEEKVTEGLKECFCSSSSHVGNSNRVSSISDLFKAAANDISVSSMIHKKYDDMRLEECCTLIEKRFREAKCTTQLQRRFWLQYMLRRSTLLTHSDQFNYNREHQALGSVTMRAMLGQVQQAVATSDQVAWTDSYHSELIFWPQTASANNKSGTSHSWSIFSVDSSGDQASWEAARKELENTGLYLPPAADLRRRDVLQSYVAHVLGIALCGATYQADSEGHPFDFAIGTLPDDDFIWTEDFALKLIRIYERIKCGVPCVLIGETGVSKTALLLELFKLINQLFCSKDSVLRRVCQLGLEKKKALQALYAELHGVVKETVQGDITCESLVASLDSVAAMLQQELSINPCLCAVPALRLQSLDDLKNPSKQAAFLSLILDIYLSDSADSARASEALFHVVNVHAAMTVDTIEAEVRKVVVCAEAILQAGQVLQSNRHEELKICLFFDEMNTTPLMGLMKEIVVNRCLNGVPLPPNIVPVAAVNPYRRKLQLHVGRQEEQGEASFAGHYNVQPLPPSLQSVAWNYGSLSEQQERQFIDQYATRMTDFPSEQVHVVTEWIFNAHQLVRRGAQHHMQKVALSPQHAEPALSLRDIIRCFAFLKFFWKLSTDLQRILMASEDRSLHWKRALLLSVAMTYYLRLGHSDDPAMFSRGDFSREFGQKSGECIESVVREVTAKLGDVTVVPPRHAKTVGLLENIYSSLVCLLSLQPLLIIGPPGTSKTLAISLLQKNAKGSASHSPFYRILPQLRAIRYQCSRTSTSTQIKDIFRLAVLKQEGAKKSKSTTRWFVFMDEAGLPEEEREGLKILHYYLEQSHMREAGVGFIAISNHILDAAKSNRCSIVLRGRSSLSELLMIGKVCVGNEQQLATVRYSSNGKILKGKLVVDGSDGDAVVNRLCRAYFAAAAGSPIWTKDSSLSASNRFSDNFGQRDFISCITRVGQLAFEQRPPMVTDEAICTAVESNFSGLPPSEVLPVVNFFLKHAEIPELTAETLKNPVVLFKNAFHFANAPDKILVSRFFLVIDPTSNDTIYSEVLRLMSDGSSLRATGLKLSSFCDDAAAQQAAMTGDVCLRAEDTGNPVCPVLLSNSDPIHENLYNLLNKSYTVNTRKGVVEYRTEVAIGSEMRTVTISPTFNLVIHATLDQLAQYPAPFLDRLEKYYISPLNILEYVLASKAVEQDAAWRRILSAVTPPVQESVQSLIRCAGRCAFFGASDEVSVTATILTQVYRRWNDVQQIAETFHRELQKDKALEDSVSSLLRRESCELCLDLTVEEMAKKMYSPRSEDARWTALVVMTLLQRLALHALFSVVVPEVLLGRWDDFSSPVLISSLLSLSPALRSANFCSPESKRNLFYTRAGKTLDLPGVHVVHLAKITAESEFHDALARHWSGNTPTVIVIDTRRVPMSQINYARYAIDAKFDKVGDCSSAITIVVQVAPSELIIRHVYDVTFTSPWRQQFFDDLQQTPKTLTWVRFAYTDLCSSKELSATLERHIPSIRTKLAAVLRKRIFNPADGYVDEAVQEEELTDLFSRTLNDKALLTRVLHRFGEVTSAVVQGVREPFMYLVEVIQRAVAQRAEGAAEGSITDMVHQSVEGACSHVLLQYCKALLGCVPCSVDCTAEQKDGEQAILWTGLEALDISLRDAAQPLQPVTVSIPTYGGMPFLNEVKEYLEYVVDCVGAEQFKKGVTFETVAPNTAGTDICRAKCMSELLNAVEHPMAPLFQRCYWERQWSGFAAVYLKNMIVYSNLEIKEHVLNQIVATFTQEMGAIGAQLSEGEALLQAHLFVLDLNKLQWYIQLWTCLVTFHELGKISAADWTAATLHLRPTAKHIAILACRALSLQTLDYHTLSRWVRTVSAVQLEDGLDDVGEDNETVLSDIDKVVLMSAIGFTAVTIEGENPQDATAFANAVASHLQFVMEYQGLGDDFFEQYWRFLTGSQTDGCKNTYRYASAIVHYLNRCGYETLNTNIGKEIESAEPHSLDLFIGATCNPPFRDSMSPLVGEETCELPPFVRWVKTNCFSGMDRELRNSADAEITDIARLLDDPAKLLSFPAAFFVVAARTFYVIYPRDVVGFSHLVVEFESLLKEMDNAFTKTFSIALDVLSWLLMEVMASELHKQHDAIARFLGGASFHAYLTMTGGANRWTSLFVTWLHQCNTPIAAIQRLLATLQGKGAESEATAKWVETVLHALETKDADGDHLLQQNVPLRSLREYTTTSECRNRDGSLLQLGRVLDKIWMVPLLYAFYRQTTSAVCEACWTRSVSDVSATRVADLLATVSAAETQRMWHNVCNALQVARDTWPECPHIENTKCIDLTVGDLVSSRTESGVKTGLLIDTVRFLLNLMHSLIPSKNGSTVLEKTHRIAQITKIVKDSDACTIPFMGYTSISAFLCCTATIHAPRTSDDGHVAVSEHLLSFVLHHFGQVNASACEVVIAFDASHAHVDIMQSMHAMLHSLSSVQLEAVVSLLSRISYSGMCERQLTATLAAFCSPECLKREVSHLSDVQLHWMLSIPSGEFVSLDAYCKDQLDRKAYLFADRDLSLKKELPPLLKARLSKLLASTPLDSIEQLDVWIIKRESAIAQQPQTPIYTLVKQFFFSESRIPTFFDVLKGLSEAPMASTGDDESSLLCCHYVSLRLLLRESRLSHPRNTIKWDGSLNLVFFSSEPSVFNESTALSTVRRPRRRPTTWVGDEMSGRAERRALQVEQLFEEMERWCNTPNTASPATIKELERVLKRYEDIGSPAKLDESVERLKVKKAEIVQLCRKAVTDWKVAMQPPLKYSSLKNVLERLADEHEGLVSPEDWATAKQKVETIEYITAMIEGLQEKAVAPSIAMCPYGALKCFCDLADESSLHQQYMRSVSAAYDTAKGKLRRLFFPSDEGRSLAEAVWRSTAVSSPPLSCHVHETFPPGRMRTALQEIEELLRFPDDRDKMDKALDALETSPLCRWSDVELFKALLQLLPCEQDFADEAELTLHGYLRMHITNKTAPSPLVWLALKRLLPMEVLHYTVLARLCLLQCHWTPFLDELLTESEKELLRDCVCVEEVTAACGEEGSSSQIVRSLTVEQEWERWRTEHAIHSPAMDKIMSMVGLTNPKRQIFSMYRAWIEKASASSEGSDLRNYHIYLLGNPGTGKKTVARRLGGLLAEMQGQPEGAFVETSGYALQEDPQKLYGALEAARGGVLFVEAADVLFDAAALDGQGPAAEILLTLKSKSGATSVALAGRKISKEPSWLHHEPAFADIMIFEDFSDVELEHICQAVCAAHQWSVSAAAARVAARRVSRRRAHFGYGNAADLAGMLEQAHKRAAARGDGFDHIIPEDVMGPPPDVKTHPGLKENMTALENLVGLKQVKSKIKQLCSDALRMYHLDLKNEENGASSLLSGISGVFLGNPGTQKTTAAAHYGRILHYCGLLSSGESVVVAPGDLMGECAKATTLRTKMVLFQCKGKALIIREAHELHYSPHGRAAIDALMSCIDGSPGEDLALLLVGDTAKTLTMLKDDTVNPAFRRCLRVDGDGCFLCEDLGKRDLERALSREAKAKNVTMDAEFRNHATRLLLHLQEETPNFGNMRSVVALLDKAISRMRTVDPERSALSPPDLTDNALK